MPIYTYDAKHLSNPTLLPYSLCQSSSLPNLKHGEHLQEYMTTYNTGLVSKIFVHVDLHASRGMSRRGRRAGRAVAQVAAGPG